MSGTAGALRLNNDDVREIEYALATAPEAHPVIVGTGGLRKSKVVATRMGKSGGLRVIYYFWVADAELYMLRVYAKNARAESGPADRKALQQIVEAIKHAKR
jgi:hypothetical protein